jgi:nucleoside-diphosphate-sugar epimerase
VQIINLKLYDTYGAGDTRPKLFATLKRILQNGEELAMSPGDQKIDILHIDDVVRAFLVCLKSIDQLPGWASYALSSGHPLKLKELIREFEVVSGGQLNVKFGLREYRHREVMQPWHTGDQLPNWQPQVNLNSGIKRFLNAD